jgi:hypothetical protein
LYFNSFSRSRRTFSRSFWILTVVGLGEGVIEAGQYFFSHLDNFDFIHTLFTREFLGHNVGEA